MFTRYSHHLNLSVIVITQSMFDISRICRLSTHYLVLFKSLNDTLNIQTIGRQIFAKQFKWFYDSYEDATRERHGYLIVCNHPQQEDERLRLIGDLFGVVKVYLPR